MNTYTVRSTGKWGIRQRVRANSADEAEGIAQIRVERLCDTKIGKRFHFMPLFDEAAYVGKIHISTGKGKGWGKPPTTFPPSLNTEAWDAWMNHRKQLRLRDYTTNLQAKRLSKLTPDQQMACVEDSIANNYQGLFTDRFNSKKGNGAWTLKRANFEARSHNQIRRSGEAEQVFIERIKEVVENFGR